ncbi:MAG: DNA-binding protein [Clostridia bacterium]|nr:DNA-binding protein [Clostridia bacterium]
MEYRRFNDTYVIRMDRGEEIMSCLTDLCQREDIRLGYVEAIGAVDRAVVGLYDVVNKVYRKQAFHEPMEMTSLLGTVTSKGGQVYLHLHVTLTDENMLAHGGHVNSLTIGGTCEMILRTLPGEVSRRLDDATGLNLFDF